MTNRRIARTRLGAGTLVVLGFACCSGAPQDGGGSVSVNQEIYLRGLDDALERQAATCADDVVGASPGEIIRANFGELTFVESTFRDGVVVAVSTEAGPAAAYFYDEEMLRSGQVYEFSLKTVSGKEHLIRTWGGDGPCQASQR